MSILQWARQLVGSSQVNSEAAAAQAASLAAADFLSDPAANEALDIAAEIGDYQQRRERITEVTLQVADKYRTKPAGGPAIVATSNETTIPPSAPGLAAPRVVQFRATNQDEAITALISSLDRRVGRRLEELNRENAVLQGRIAELTGVVADLATRNSDLDRSLAALGVELNQANQEKAAALDTVARLQSEAIGQREVAAARLAAVEADARAQLDAVRTEMQRKLKGGSKLAWVVAFLVAAAAAVMFVLN